MKKKFLCAILTGVMICSVPVYAKDSTVTVPAYVVDFGISDFPESQSSSVADDGSTVYTLNEDQQKEWKEYLKASLDDAIKNVLSDKETYPNIEGMTYNDDMTEFNVNISSADNMTMSEAFVGYFPLFFAPLYQEANGVDTDKVDYKMISVDSSTGDKYESDYKQIKADWDSSSFSVSSSSSNSAQSSSYENVDVISFSSDISALEYTGFETMPYDSSSTDILGVVKFNFSNKADTPTDVSSRYRVKAYQNGIELEWYAGTGNIACDNTYKTILKDASLEVGFAFMLQDAQSSITVYAYDGHMGDAPCQVQEISIQ